MDIRVLEKEENKISFVLKGTNNSFANLLRRYIVENVPTMAAEDVEIKDNSSVLYDEVLAHRIGLLPLTTDIKSYVNINECKCEGKGCNRCTLKLTLVASGPGTVYASEIKSKDPKVKPVYPKTPIVKLLKEQKVEVIITAVLSQGRDHAKYSPGFSFFKLKPEVKISKNPANFEDVANSCPVNVFDVKDGKLNVNKDNEMKCHLCNQCVDIVDPKDALEVIGGPDIIFTLDNWGQLSHKEVVAEAMDQFTKDLDQLEKLLKNKK